MSLLPLVRIPCRVETRWFRLLLPPYFSPRNPLVIQLYVQQLIPIKERNEHDDETTR